MTQRLTQERFNEICDMELPKGRAVTAIAELLDEVYALRAELAGAEERGRKLERADTDAWMRDRDAARERNAEDIFEAGYRKAPRGAGHSECVHRGMTDLAVAIGSGLHTGEAAAKHRHDDFEEGIVCGRNMERADAVHHLRTRRQATAVCTEGSARSRAADEIERGDHVRAGTAAADGGTAGESDNR